MGLDWEARGVLADFRACQRASQNTNLVFHCANGHVSAHQMIFAGISPFFTDLMQRFVIGRELFPLDLNISLPEIRREHVEMVVEMVYTGQVPITKRDYQPFREICQLLQLSVPIADYDIFFMHQSSKEDRSYFFEPLDSQNKPLKSQSSPRVFVCDECNAIFPLNIALKRHKKSQHDESESEAPYPQQSPIVTEPSTVEPQLNARPTRQRPLNDSKNLVCLQNDERVVECPDCQSLLNPRHVREHLAVHLQKELDALVMRSEPVSGIFKCQESPCSYETAEPFHMVRHLGATHDFITKFANKAQMKFIHDAEELICKRTSSLKLPCNSSPEKIKKNLNQPRTSQHILENEDDPEKNNDIDPEIENARKDSTERESQSFNKPDELNPPLLTQLNQPSSSSHNNEISKTSSNDQYRVKCPDCMSLLRPGQARHHLAIHIRKHLNPLVAKSKSVSGLFKCKVCSYETTYQTNMRSHLALTHNMIRKFANEAQKKFLHDAREMTVQLRCLSLNGTIPKSSQNDGRIVECPDCHSLIHPSRVKYHLTSHLRKELNEFLKRSESKPEVFECQFCSYEATFRVKMQHHVGEIHDMMLKFANVAQKKFLLDAQNMMPKPRRKRKKLFSLRTRNPILETDDLSESEDNNVEIEGKKDLEDAINNESPLKDERALECPDCQSLIHPVRARDHLTTHMRENLNKHMTKSESVCGLMKCQLCSHETTSLHGLQYHIGAKHQMMMKYANAAQEKFIYDAQRMLLMRRRPKSSKKKKLNKPPQCEKSGLSEKLPSFSGQGAFGHPSTQAARRAHDDQ